MKIRPQFLIIGITALTLVATTAACGGDSKDDPTPVSSVTPTPTPTLSENSATGVLQYTVIQEGDGEGVQTGDIVELNYTASLEDGTQLDSSADSGQTLKFAAGMGQILPGIDQGVAKMKVHGKAKLVIPPELAFGAMGSQNGMVPPNTTLVFELELVSVTRPEPPVKVNESDYKTEDSGVKYYDFVVGTGATPAEKDSLLVTYTMWRDDGTRIMSTTDSAQPALVVFDKNQKLHGVYDGVATMKVGGKRQVVVPPALGFGEAGAGDSSIPPNTTLILEIQLLAVIPLPSATPQTAVKEDQYTTTASGLKYYDIKVGDGAVPTHGQQVLVHYTGWLTDGTEFDSSIPRGETLPFMLGVGQMIPGFDEGVSTMKIGGKRQMVLPPELAYKDQAMGKIPANSTLIFEVELMYAY